MTHGHQVVRCDRRPRRVGWHRWYCTQVTQTASPLGPTLHLVVCRHDGRPVRAAWGVLQQIKNEILGEQVCAVEVFPAQADLVDEANYRHLWAVPPQAVPSLRR